MHDTLPLLKDSDFPQIYRKKLETLQVNIGLRCNLACLHCHTNSNPYRKEAMNIDTINHILDFLKKSDVKTLDITGGAPEMHPQFRYLVQQARKYHVHVIDRCNLTILEEPDQEYLAVFLADNKVEIIASLPCYSEDNVDAQRGKGVFESSIRELKKLNRLGYGWPDSGLILNLVYNPLGPTLPPDQNELEKMYKKELSEQYGIVFNKLFTLCNMPIKRFGSILISRGQFSDYLSLLINAHRNENLENVMCRSLVSVDWQGYLYDCDFNQMLDLPMQHSGKHRIHISELINENIENNSIFVCNHCYGCTAGQGSSCGGALTA